MGDKRPKTRNPMLMTLLDMLAGTVVVVAVVVSLGTAIWLLLRAVGAA